MEKIKKMNEYLSNLAVLNANLHNLHWNVEGLQFVQLHEFTEKLYSEFFEKYDSVAEILKMQGYKPLVKLSDYLKTASIKELDKDVFTTKEVLQTVLDYLNTMKTMALEIRELADKEDDFVTVNEFEDHITEYNKHIWFVKSMLA
ncbi:MAG TPA: DNA starvation/stationary phase protection protein [Bacteroidales bacterium]|jgi:starvation-inducible DNA-binding protein|nr:MAG: DNA protection during starvation protein [Tenericutes bacterium ADurb.Bin140]HON64450.1 DNA starvation/stationary phase protection protein [Bacilli bacterium]HOS16517.1 DNA starvation/stationary phase protection protein [Bacteroidales bacterium]HPD12886.1 DNA starvation/stationary phase protection protein [Bacilli bacterium]HPK58907.1 DNA starvation/stationary phase protection protein [Bacilli bacterium]